MSQDDPWPDPSPADDGVPALRAKIAALEREIATHEAFGAAVRHDLRTPLTAIQGFGDLVAASFGDALGERGLDYLSNIQDAAARIEDIIDASRRLADAGRLPIHPVDVDLSALGQAAVKRLRSDEPARRAEVVIPPGLTARGDERLLGVVMDELFDNAWHFTGRADPAFIELSVATEGGERVYRLQDNGLGFDPAQAEAIFLPFKRAHGSDDFGGTGMGLAIVARIVDRHGGRAWAEGGPQRGATVSFTLGG